MKTMLRAAIAALHAAAAGRTNLSGRSTTIEMKRARLA